VAQSSVDEDFSKDRPLLPHTLLVGLELPPGKFVTPVLVWSWAGGAADLWGGIFHWRGLGRTLEQTPALRRAIRTQIGIAGFMTDGRDHLGATGCLRCGLGSAAFETAVESKPRPRVGKFVAAAAAVRHYRDFPE